MDMLKSSESIELRQVGMVRMALAQTWRGTTGLLAWLGRTLGGGLSRLGQANVSARAARPDSTAVARGTELFASAVRDGSNLEMDWLWMAEQVTREYERRYCLEQALRINPDSETARRELAKLPAIPGGGWR